MSEETELPAQNYGPGNVLRAKREEYEWSIEAVAEALHLSTSSVRAIEADRYEDLPGATYVIGYWRSYARLLGIDIEESIEANKRNLNIVVPEAAGINVNRAHSHKTGGGFLWWGFLLIALAAFGYYAWQQQFFGLLDQVKWFRADQPVVSQGMETGSSNTQQVPVIKETEVLRPAENAEEQVSEPQITQALNPALNPSTVSVSEDGPPEQIKNSILRPIENNAATSNLSDSVTQNPAQANVQQGLVLPSEVNQSQSNTAEGTTNNFLQNQTGNTSSNNLATQQDNAGTLAAQDMPNTGLQNAINDAAAADGSTMILNLNKDSWLDIRDKTNKRLIYRTETAGKQLTVKGTPPFYVYIGTPSGVTITYKGQNVPFETHKSGLFARFKLGDTLESL